jgi:hypothetical protein
VEALGLEISPDDSTPTEMALTWRSKLA